MYSFYHLNDRYFFYVCIILISWNEAKLFYKRIAMKYVYGACSKNKKKLTSMEWNLEEGLRMKDNSS